jgi:hypothetical protein
MTIKTSSLETNQSAENQFGNKNSEENSAVFIPKNQEVGDLLEDSFEQEAEKEDSQKEKSKENDIEEESSKRSEWDLTPEELEEVAAMSDEELEEYINGASEPEESDDSEDTSEEEDDADNDSEKSDENKNGFKKGVEKLKTQRDELREKNKALEEQAKELKERLDAIESKLEEKGQKKEEEKPKKPLTEKELVGIIKDFMDEGDAEGIYDVMKYMTKQVKDELTNEYRKETTQQQEVATRKNAEWQSIVKDYSASSYDNEILSSDPDFDINNSKGKLFTTAKSIYETGVVKKEQRYLSDGGMAYAVQQAFTALLKDVVSKGPKKAVKKVKEPEGLKQRLLKEQRKRSLMAGSSGADASEKLFGRSKADKDELSEYLSERNKFKDERSGSSFV